MALGIDRLYWKCCINNEESKIKLLIGMQQIFKYHSSNYHKAERADIMGELLLNGEMFGKEAGSRVAQKVSKLVTSVVSSPLNILRSVDTHGGALNDNVIHQYAKIEREYGLIDMKGDGSMLHHRS